MFNDLQNELITMNVEHALTMAYLNVSDVLIRNTELPFGLYEILREDIKRELNKLKVDLIKKIKQGHS